VAYHFQQAGDARAVDWLIQAGERATRTYAWRTAGERFDAAVQLMDGDASRARERGQLLFRLGRIVRWSNPAAGVAYMIEAHRTAVATGDQALEAFALADRGLLRCVSGEIRRGIEDMAAGAELLERLPADGEDGGLQLPWTVEFRPRWEHGGSRRIDISGRRPEGNPRRGTLAQWLAVSGRYAEAIAMAESCLDDIAPGSIVRDHQDFEASFALGLAYADIGRPDNAHAMLTRAREMYREIRHHSMVVASTLATLSHITIPYRTAALTERGCLAAEAEAAWAQGRGSLPEGVAPEIVRSAVSYIEGQWQQILELLNIESVPLIARFSEWTVVLGQVLRHQGAPALAWAQVQKIFPEGSSTDPGGHWFSTANEAQRLAAGLALDDADLRTARTWLDAHDRWLVWSGATRGRAEGRLVWAHYQLASGDPAAARVWAQQALADAREPRQPLTLLAAQRFLGQLDTEAGCHADAERRLSESLALADACAAPFERALTLLALAELRAAAGQRDAARSLLAEVRRICEPLGAAPTLARVGALAVQLANLPADPGRAATG
jgi:tetratricopeptide (TPR) repeat protein